MLIIPLSLPSPPLCYNLPGYRSWRTGWNIFVALWCRFSFHVGTVFLDTADEMKIVIFSDSHDNVSNLEAALSQAQEADVLIHCGDLCSPFIVERMGSMLNGIPVHVVWGNNEGDVRLICRNAANYPNLELHGEFASLSLDGLRVAVNHYPEIARSLAASGEYDLVCYGHDHIAHHSIVSSCSLLNPGQIMGMNGKATFASFDTQTRSVKFVNIG